MNPTTLSSDVIVQRRAQKKQYLRIVYALWQDGAVAANKEYPQISVEEFETANKYFNSLRCKDCFCGSCVKLPELASNLDESPEPLVPIANLARYLKED